METLSHFSLLTLTILLTPFVLFKLIKSFRRSGNADKKLPPGPWKLPLIGNILSMVSSEPPHHVLRNLAQNYGPIMHLQLGEIPAIVVSSSQVAKEILVNHDLAFASRPEILSTKVLFYNSTDIACSPYGSYWRQMRKICTLELLSTKKVQSFSFIREEEVGSLIKYFMSSSGSPVNLSEYAFTLMNTITSRAAFGMIYKDQDILIQMLEEATKQGVGFDVADLFPSYKYLFVVTGQRYKLEKLHQSLDKILNNIFDNHNKILQDIKGLKEEDLLDILFRFKDSGDLEFPITFDNIKAVVLDVFVGGTHTAASTVEWAMSELVRNPRVLKKAQAEVREVLQGKKEVHEGDIQDLKYLKLVIKETMRLHPSLPLLLPRECRESCQINGYVIPIKTKVIINAWALGRDSEYWYDAESFVPERFENSSHDFKGTNLEYLPFGAGRRICPGISFGLANVDLVLASFLYHFNWELPFGMKAGDLDMRETFGSGVRRKTSLKLIPTLYSPLE